MRICIVSRGDLFPTNHGAAVKIVRTAEALSRAGAPTCIVTDDRDHYLRYTDGECEKVTFSTRFRAAEEWPPLPWIGRLAEQALLRLGYPREELFLYRPMLDPAWWGRVLMVGRVEAIDVFQAEFPGYGVPSAIAAQILGLISRSKGGARQRSCIVQHNVEWDRLEEFGHDVKRMRPIEQAVLGMVDDVIAVSLDDRRRMVAAGLPAEKVSVIPHGVDLHRFARASGAGIRERHGVPADVPLLFFHGTLHYWPNTEAVRFMAERLLPILLQAHPDLRIMVTGPNPPQYYRHPALVYTGVQENLEAHIAAADVCICPLFAGGGTRMKLLEYMAAGKPIISTAKGAEGLQIEDGVQMLLREDAQSMTEAVSELLAEPQRARALGAAALEFAAHYDWSVVAQSYIELYQGQGRGEDWNPRLLRADPPPAILPIDAHIRRQEPSKPRTMLLLINRGCNLRCSFCDLWDKPDQMELDQLIPLLEQAVQIGTKTLVITGGEPFMHKGLFHAVRAARALGMHVNITTNGTFVDKRWDALASSGVDSLSFSIDGLEKNHDLLRGKEGSYKKTIEALKRVLEVGMHASVYMVVTRENVRELPQVHAMVTELGADFDFWPVNDAPEHYLRSPEDRSRWKAALAALSAIDPQIAARRAYYETALDYHADGLGAVRCLGLVDQYGVTYDGRFLPCCVWGGEGLTVGNVFETPLTELWTRPEVQRYREGLFHEGCTAGCFNHSLYEFEQSTGQSFRPDGSLAAAR
jgi:MoaA/NifB/PqqE/SkfB family radical SAM enzyme/glycosyltransferase involved in cell wall biosynthesis